MAAGNEPELKVPTAGLLASGSCPSVLSWMCSSSARQQLGQARMVWAKHLLCVFLKAPFSVTHNSHQCV